MKRAAAFLLLAGTSACALHRPASVYECPSYRSAELATLDLRRIVLVPFHDESGSGPHRETVERAMAHAIEKESGIAVVLVGDAGMREIGTQDVPHRTGRYRLEPVLELAFRYGADAILFGSITAFRAYTPQVLGVRAELVSASTGLVVWSVDAHFDLSDENARRALEAHFGDRASRVARAPSWETAQTSPAAIASLVCSRAASTIRAGR